MSTDKEKTGMPVDSAKPRQPYAKPAIRRVDLAVEETLSSGCKLVTACDAPPEPDEDGGS